LSGKYVRNRCIESSEVYQSDPSGKESFQVLSEMTPKSFSGRGFQKHFLLDSLADGSSQFS
jgi:hypothetical protein